MSVNIEAKKRPYMSNRDLLVIAVLSGIGGAMSTYIGYLGNLLNRMLGVPFGAGQFAAGLHVFWIILAAGLVRKPGAATAAGLLKGSIEFLTGGTHGIAIIVVSLVQGLLVDLVLLLFRRYSLPGLALAGGIAAASNVIVFQSLYFSGAPLIYIVFISGLAFVSGLILAGGFGFSVLNIIQQARPLQMGTSSRGEFVSASSSKMQRIMTGLLILIFVGGAVYYFAEIYESPWGGPQCTVAGSIEKPLTFQLSDFSDHTQTIRAELAGQVTYVPEQEYTGIPLHIILKQAKPQQGASTLNVIATDGYSVKFDLSEVLKDDQMLLIEEEDQLRLIAGNYDGGYWVRQVSKLVIE